MGVQLNIKDQGTVELARDLARSLGKSVTETVREALEEKRRRRDAEIAEKVRIGMEIAERASKHWRPETAGMTSKELMDSIYDEHGLPA
jgi:hypothetical protein